MSNATKRSQAFAVVKNKLKLDRIYLNILSILQTQGRITNQDLAEQVGLSPSPCLERVRKLEQTGYIDSYLASVNLDKICSSVTVFATVTLHNHKQEDFEGFEFSVKAMPEVVDCCKVSGPFDYILRFVCASMAHYDELSDRLLNNSPVALQMSSHAMLKKTKDFAGYPLDRLVEL